MSEENIWENATCANPLNDPDWWFEPVWEQRAKRICAECPLKTKCLAYAIENKEPFGVWGGLTPDERRLLRIRNGKNHS